MDDDEEALTVQIRRLWKIHCGGPRINNEYKRKSEPETRILTNVWILLVGN